MINTRFECYKIKREIKRSGKQYSIIREQKNKFGEPQNTSINVGNIVGIYHEQNSNIQINTGDAIQIRTKKIPMILSLYNEVADIGIVVGDYINLNGRIFKVTGITDIQEWHIAADISLEGVDAGGVFN